MNFEIVVSGDATFGQPRKVVIFAESRTDALKQPNRVKGSRVVEVERCNGEAHRPEVGGMIDNCLLCAPRWGWCIRKPRIAHCPVRGAR
jgi:hypothetical protein